MDEPNTAMLYAIKNFTTGGWVGGDDGPWSAHTMLYSAKAPASSEINFRKGKHRTKPWRVTTDDLRVIAVPVPEPEVDES
jgi:hypothetical protein